MLFPHVYTQYTVLITSKMVSTAIIVFSFCHENRDFFRHEPSSFSSRIVFFFVTNNRACVCVCVCVRVRVRVRVCLCVFSFARNVSKDSIHQPGCRNSCLRFEREGRAGRGGRDQSTNQQKLQAYLENGVSNGLIERSFVGGIRLARLRTVRLGQLQRLEDPRRRHLRGGPYVRLGDFFRLPKLHGNLPHVVQALFQAFASVKDFDLEALSRGGVAVCSGS